MRTTVVKRITSGTDLVCCTVPRSGDGAELAVFSICYELAMETAVRVMLNDVLISDSFLLSKSDGQSDLTRLIPIPRGKPALFLNAGSTLSLMLSRNLNTGEYIDVLVSLQ